MTDKEQIKCKYKFQDKEKFDNKPYCTCFNELCEDLSFVCDYNCQIFEDYKQLARKTQECEELKEYAQRQENQREEYYKEYLKLSRECEELKQELDLYKTWYRAKHDDIRNLLGNYRKALEEIKKVCIEDTREFADGTTVRYDSLDDILDIINKVKGK